MSSSFHRPTRAGFTLIELLVVIAIIAVLVGLTTAAVQRVRVAGKRGVATHEINQLDAAVSNFKKDTGFYPPTTFVIPSTVNSNDVNYQYLKRMFNRWPVMPAAAGGGPAPEGTLLANTATGALAGQGTTLKGMQVVVYFLGGPNGTGWANDAPTAPAAGVTTKKTPWYDFTNARLSGGIGNGNIQKDYNDPWDTPYAYFASNSNGDYTASDSLSLPNSKGQYFQVNPYYTGSAAAPKWLNPGKVQIICAGPDSTRNNGGIGPGGLWTPSSGQWANGARGDDDMCNFNGGATLGSSGP